MPLGEGGVMNTYLFLYFVKFTYLLTLALALFPAVFARRSAIFCQLIHNVPWYNNKYPYTKTIRQFEEG